MMAMIDDYNDGVMVLHLGENMKKYKGRVRITKMEI